MNLLVRISARNIKLLKARRAATMRIMPRCLRGSFKATVSLRNCIGNSCISRPCIWRKGAINERGSRIPGKQTRLACSDRRRRQSCCPTTGISARAPKNAREGACAPQAHMNFKLRIWRQREAKSGGKLVNYDVRDISPDTSFLEMLDILNENLIRSGGGTVAFDSDCRGGVCGACSLTVNRGAHGPEHPAAVRGVHKT